MISRVIINADDFGLTSGVSRAIVEAHRNGIVSSTTVLANCDQKLLEEAQELSKQNPKLGIGAHLVLTTRKPLLDTHKTLVDDMGNFKYRFDTIDDLIDTNEVYAEWKAQIERLQEYFTLTHFDSHHHVHMNPKLSSIAHKLSDEFKLPIRAQHDRFPRQIETELGFYDQAVTTETLINAMSNRKGLIEIMVHPGYADDVFLDEISSYSAMREKELEILTNSEIQDFLKKENIELVNYGVIHLK